MNVVGGREVIVQDGNSKAFEKQHIAFFSYFSIFHYSSVSEDSMPMPDEVSMLTAIALFLWSASSEIIGVQSLQNGCMNRFKNALNSCDPWVSCT